MIKITFAGGGTGGHIYPGLAVAEELQSRGFALSWIGSEKDLDRRIVEKAGLDFFAVPSGKLRRYFSVKNFTDIANIVRGFFAARKILKQEKPELLFSKGGFVSVPPVLASYSLGIPVFTHESDYSPGLATRINSRFSHRILLSYQETKSRFHKTLHPRIVVTGNPVRAVFKGADADAGLRFLDAERPVLLVLGGSQGARELNELVTAHLSELSAAFTVVHQTGGDLKGLPTAGPRYKPFAYIEKELPAVLAAADLVLGRSGAGTVWECAAAGKPMVLLPLRGSGTRGDQVENAAFFERMGAARVARDSKEALAAVLELAADANTLLAMASAAADIGAKNSAGAIAEVLAAFLSEKKKE